MGDILSKLKMVSEKVGVTETAQTIEEQIDLIIEHLDAVPKSTNIAEALDDLSEVADKINVEPTYTVVTFTGTGTELDPYVPAYETNQYYTKSGDVYTKVTSDSEPASWGTADTFYTRDE